MITTKEALRNIFKFTSPTQKFRINLINANDYFLSEDVISPINMPPFKQSAMDGYAVHVHSFNTYNLIGEIQAGDANKITLKPGEAIRIFTGAAVPETATAVIMQEKVIAEENSIIVNEGIVIASNIRPIGEQVKKGNLALKNGTKLTPAGIGFLASLGITYIEVYKKPSIAIVTTGNELIAAGSPLKYGQIYQSNSVMITSALNSLGYHDVSNFKVKDDYNDTYNLLETISTNFDVILISGGISVGDYDFVGTVLEALNVNEIFYKINQKPGKPLYFGKKGNVSVFALPGNPAAALSCFYIYVHPALELLSGNINYKLPKTLKKSNSSFIKKGNKAQFLKAIVNQEKVTILEGQSSAMLQTFALANALVYMPSELKSISINDAVEVILLPK